MHVIWLVSHADDSSLLAHGAHGTRRRGSPLIAISYSYREGHIASLFIVCRLVRSPSHTMKLLTLSALVLSTASFISATPAPIAGPQGVVDLVSWAGSALNEQLGHLSAVEDDGMKTMASWSWTDCGELACSLASWLDFDLLVGRLRFSLI
jgi:hypothetical protein